MRKQIIIALFIIFFRKLSGQRLFLSVEIPYHPTSLPKEQKMFSTETFPVESYSIFKTNPYLLQSVHPWHIKSYWFQEPNKEKKRWAACTTASI